MLYCYEADWSWAGEDFWSASEWFWVSWTYADLGSFETHMDETIAKHPKEAALGGVPGKTNKARAYVDVTMRAKEAQDSFKPEVRSDYLRS
jgi:hypothetical protein